MKITAKPILGAFLTVFALAACNLLGGLPLEETQVGQPAASSGGVKATPTRIPSAETQPAAAPALATPTPTGSSDEAVYAVVLVREDDVLNVRREAGVEQDILATLAPQAVGVRGSGQEAQMNGGRWLAVQTEAGQPGWVNARYLTEYVSHEEYCADARIEALLAGFEQAILTSDGDALAALVHPARGLTIRYNWWNPEVNYSPTEAAGVFVSQASKYWGIQDGSGLPIRGSFSETVLPQLLDVVVEDHTSACNTLEFGVASGGSAGIVAWPFEYGNVNYTALYRPAPPEQELDWRTWTVGIEYVHGAPVISFLVQYAWEI